MSLPELPLQQNEIYELNFDSYYTTANMDYKVIGPEENKSCKSIVNVTAPCSVKQEYK